MLGHANSIMVWLMAGHTITALEALEMFGCFRLAARIHDIRSAGYKVGARTITTDSGKRFSQYYWIGKI